MLAVSPILSFLISSALIALSCFTGRLLLPPRLAGRNPWWVAALWTGLGLVFWVGVSATWISGRFCYGTLLAVLPMALRFFVSPADGEGSHQKMWVALAQAAVLWGLISLLSFWQFRAEGSDDQVRVQHSDFGYFAMLAMGIAEAEVSDHWAATMGKAAAPSHDVWYHWAPIWLASGLWKLTGLPAWDALYCVIAPVLQWLIVLLAAEAIKSLARWPSWAALLGGLVATLGVQRVKMFGVAWSLDWLPNGTVQHMRYSALMHYPYFFEGVLLLLTLVSWIKGKGRLATAFLFLASVSSPHNVAAGGAAVGTLMLLGILAKRRDLWLPAAWATATILCAWGIVKWGFGADLPKAEGQPLLVLSPSVMLWNLRNGILDMCIGLGIHLLLLPGLAVLMRKPQTAVLGWLAFSGIIGSYIAHGLMEGLSDSWHITALCHAMIVVPVSIWGLCVWWQDSGRWLRTGITAIMGLTLAMGMHDFQRQWNTGGMLPLKRNDILTLRQALDGQTFGYHAESDRHWWIPTHSTLAALLHARCVRLNRLDSVEGDGHSRYYGHRRIESLLPKPQSEDRKMLPVRIAEKLGVRYVLETPTDRVPETMRSALTLVLRTGDATLWTLSKTSSSVPTQSEAAAHGNVAEQSSP